MDSGDLTVWAAHAPNYDYSNVDFYEENTVVDAEGDLAANTLLDYQHEDQAVVEEEARALHHTVQEIYKKQRIFHLILLLGEPGCRVVLCSAPSVPQPVFTITEKAPTRAFSWLKAPISAFTFKDTMLNRPSS